MTESENMAKAIANAAIERARIEEEEYDRKTTVLKGPGFVIRDIDGRVFLEFVRPSAAYDLIVPYLRNYIGQSMTSRLGMRIPSAILTPHIENIKRDWAKNDVDIEENYATTVLPVYEYFKARRSAEIARVKESVARGMIEYADLPLYFCDGDKVTWGSGADRIAGPVRGVTYHETWTGAYARVEVDVIHNLTGVIKRDAAFCMIPAFGEPKSINDISLKKLDADPVAMAELIKRGYMFRKYATGAHYVQYSGNITRRSWMSSTTFRAEGRVMIDAPTFNRIDSDQFDTLMRGSGLKSKSSYYDEDSGNSEGILKIEDDELYMTWPYVFGFSFRAKIWGQMKIHEISDIKYREDAFERLVMDEDQKKMIRALVEHNGSSFSDIVDDKGGGCIFMLHGEPGQGKTLTAETVAELLRRPLYAVSVGELGTDPDDLEERLREILDVATVWNAVLLLDEADIFLEARDEHDILRNAMVGVFLRLLEYHQGVLFLTTNRVRNIDRAFYSRISVAVKFGKADSSKREKIWTNLLDAAGINLSEKEISSLAVEDINGRQIKNVIRLTQTLCKADKSKVSFNSIKKTIQMTTRFEEEMKNAANVLLSQDISNVKSISHNR